LKTKLIVALLIVTPLLSAGCDSNQGAATKLESSKHDSAFALEDILSWIPPSAESLIVARGPFSVQEARAESEKSGIETAFQNQAVGPLGSLADGAFYKHLSDNRVLLAVEASGGFRGPEGKLGLGEMRYKGVHAVYLENGSDTGIQKFMSSIRHESSKVLKMDGNEVFLLEKHTENYGSWSFLISEPKPDILILATDEGELREVLSRMKERRADRSFPSTSPEWKLLNQTKTAWAMRHYDHAESKLDPSSPLGGKAAANVADDQAVGFACTVEGFDRITCSYISGNKDRSDVAERLFSGPLPVVKPNSVLTKAEVVEMKFVLANARARREFLLRLLSALGHGAYL
jgi:hypothetical protein